MDNIRALVIIPAKMDSTRVKNKNLRIIAGQTLLEHSLDYAMKSKYTIDIIVTSESIKVADLVHGYRHHNILDVYTETLLGRSSILKRGKFTYYIDRTSDTWDSWEDWCEKVVWWSNKKGAYLYDCLVTESEHKIKSKLPVIRIESEPFGSDARYQ